MIGTFEQFVEFVETVAQLAIQHIKKLEEKISRLEQVLENHDHVIELQKTELIARGERIESLTSEANEYLALAEEWKAKAQDIFTEGDRLVLEDKLEASQRYHEMEQKWRLDAEKALKDNGYVWDGKKWIAVSEAVTPDNEYLKEKENEIKQLKLEIDGLKSNNSHLHEQIKIQKDTYDEKLGDVDCIREDIIDYLRGIENAASDAAYRCGDLEF